MSTAARADDEPRHDGDARDLVDQRTALPATVRALLDPRLHRGAGALAAAVLLTAATLGPAGQAGAAIRPPIGRVVPRAFAAVPHRAPVTTGQHITGHPAVLAAVNAARARNGWPAAKAGSNTAAETCALDSTRCNGVQWGGCGLTPLAGDRYTISVGTAESNGPRGCVQTISYSSFG